PSTLFPYTTLFRSTACRRLTAGASARASAGPPATRERDSPELGEREDGPRDHQPEDREHGRERRKAEREPPPKEPVVGPRERLAAAHGVEREIPHPHLHPHDRQ